MEEDVEPVAGVGEANLGGLDALEGEAGLDVAVVNGGDEDDVGIGSHGLLGNHLEEVDVVLALAVAADGADAAFEFVEKQDEFAAGERRAEGLDAGRTGAGEIRADLVTDDLPKGVEGEIGELAEQDDDVGRNGEF